MIAAALLSALAPAFDALQNAVSYLMLANPLDFADGLALPYSSLGVLAGLSSRWPVRWQKAGPVLTRAPS